MADYNSEVAQYRKKCKDRIKRQFLIADTGNDSRMRIFRVFSAPFIIIQRSPMLLFCRWKTKDGWGDWRNDRHRQTADVVLRRRKTTCERIPCQTLTSRCLGLSFQILADSQKAKDALADIEARHQDILALERNIIEIKELFFEVANLIESQVRMANPIESQTRMANPIESHVRMANLIYFQSFLLNFPCRLPFLPVVEPNDWPAGEQHKHGPGQSDRRQGPDGRRAFQAEEGQTGRLIFSHRLFVLVEFQ